MASEMLSKVLDAENSDREAQKAAHEQAQITVDAAVEAGEGAVARKKAEAAKRIYATTDKARGALKHVADEEGYETFVVPDDVGGRFSVLTAVGHGDGYLMKRLINYRKVRRCQVGKA